MSALQNKAVPPAKKYEDMTLEEIRNTPEYKELEKHLEDRIEAFRACTRLTEKDFQLRVNV